MSKVSATVRKYWNDPETNIFKNYIDALLGTVILVILPIVSLIFTVFVEDASFSNYIFPIMSVALAGAYDTYGRYEFKSPKNIKLGIRLSVDFLSVFLSAVLVHGSLLLRLIPPGFLVLVGLTIGHEVFIRVKTAIEVSPWFLKGEE